MKNLLLFVFLLPVFSYAQKLPDDGFDKVRIADQEKIIQAELLPVGSDPIKKTDRFYYWYSSNVIHVTQGSFSGTLLNGTYNEYYPDKSLKSQGQFKKGLKDGIWRSWNEKGILNELYTWKKGWKDGHYELFDDQGNLKESGEYKNNVVAPPSASTFWKRLEFFKKKKS